MIYGDNGEDTIFAGAGNDRYYGGAGADEFRFSTGFGDDKIGDFDVAEDILQLDNALWGSETDPVNVVAAYADITPEGVQFDFNGTDKILLEGLTSTTGLADAMVIV